MRSRPDASPSTRAQRAQPRTSASAQATTSASAAPTMAPITPASFPVPGPAVSDNGKIRVSKLMSERGLCSRREADEYIERGWVYVDGVRVDELGTRINPTQA